MSNENWWYIARSGGFVAWALSAVSVLWGLLLTTRLLNSRVKNSRLLDLHRFLGGLSVVFTLIHMAGLYFHKFKEITFGPRELLVPGASKVTPGAVTYGVIAFYLLVAVEVTSLMRRRVSQRVWRFVHYLSFAVLLFGSVHALKAGTDVHNSALRWPAALVCALIIGLGVARSFGRPLAMGGTGTQSDLEIDTAPERPAPRLQPVDTGSPAPTPHRDAPESSERYLGPQPRPSLRSLGEPVLAPATQRPPATPTPAPAEPAFAPWPFEPAAASAPAETTAPPAVDVQAVAPRSGATGLDRSILERARAGLERLDTAAYPQAPIPAEILTQRPTDLETPTAEPALPARSADIAMRYAKLRQPTTDRERSFGPREWPPTELGGLAEPAAPAPAAFTPMPLSAPPSEAISAPQPAARVEHYEPEAPADGGPSVPQEWLRPLSNGSNPAPAPTPSSRRINWTGVDPIPSEPPGQTRQAASALPSRTPHRLSQTTAPARSLGEWTPQREAVRRSGGAPPPPEPDPATGEVPPDAYRTWLREWLAFAESYDG